MKSLQKQNQKSVNACTTYINLQAHSKKWAFNYPLRGSIDVELLDEYGTKQTPFFLTEENKSR
jgi:hypothetical protein